MKMKNAENGMKIAVPTTGKEQSILTKYKYESIDDSGNVNANPVILLAILQRMDEKERSIEVELNLCCVESSYRRFASAKQTHHCRKALEIGYADDYESMTYAWIPSNKEVLESYYAIKGLKRAFKMGVVIPRKIHLTVRTDEDGLVFVAQGKSEYDTLNICRVIKEFC